MYEPSLYGHGGMEIQFGNALPSMLLFQEEWEPYHCLIIFKKAFSVSTNIIENALESPTSVHQKSFNSTPSPAAIRPPPPAGPVLLPTVPLLGLPHVRFGRVDGPPRRGRHRCRRRYTRSSPSGQCHSSLPLLLFIIYPSCTISLFSVTNDPQVWLI